MPEVLRCRRRHAHLSAERRDQCDARYYDQRGFAKLSALQFAPPPRVLVQQFPGVSVRLDDAIDVVVFTAEQILPHERQPGWVALDGDEATFGGEPVFGEVFGGEED